MEYAGQKFNRLLIVKELPSEMRGKKNPTKVKMVLCRCDCGVEKKVALYKIKHGSTKSCGCLNHQPREKVNKNIKVACSECGCLFEKNKYHYNEAIKKGYSNFYCNDCYFPKWDGVDERQFTVYIGRIKIRSNSNDERFMAVNDKTITSLYLKDLFNAQGGCCALSGVKLAIPLNSCGDWDVSIPKRFRASLDRINNQKGYEIGNVRFVTMPINFALNDKINDNELVDIAFETLRFKNKKELIKIIDDLIVGQDD